MKKRYIILFIIILLVCLPQYLNEKREENRNMNHFVKVNYPGEWRLLFSRIDDLNYNMNEKNIENVLETFDRVIYDVISISDNISHYYDINENYDETIFGLETVLIFLGEKMKKDNGVSELSLEIINEIKEANERYQIIRSKSIYKKPKNPYKKMELPQEVVDYVNELEVIRDKYVSN